MTRLADVSQAWAEWAWAASWQFALFVVLATIACRLLRRASPRLRHGLWMLALLKLLTPPTLSAPWSLGNWLPLPNVPASLGTTMGGPNQSDTTSTVPGETNPAPRSPEAGHAATASTNSTPSDWTAPAMLVWSVGMLLFWGVVGWRYRRMAREAAVMPTIDEGPLRIELERWAQHLRITRVPDLHVTDAFTSPFLFGLLRPRIVLPHAIIDELDPDDQRTVLLHELMHWRRRDTWIGVGQIIVQGLFWLHPLVWWAAAQLRSEREHVCDEAVVRLGSVSPRQYGDVIVHVLKAARGRSEVAGSLVGVFERGSQLQQRLENVMSYEDHRRTFGWGSRAALCGFALLFLPMARSAAAPPEERPAATVADAAKTDASAAEANKTDDKPQNREPQIVETVPAAGAAGVDAGVAEIRITFDRDMGKGMSWTGGPPLFPPVDKNRKAEWVDARTCVLPVLLKRGEFYRLGINSTSHQNFKSADGVPVASSAIYFATAGASRSVEQRIRVPQVVELEPANNATDVDPATNGLRVTFDMPMGEGMSWTGGGEAFPKSPQGERARWSKDGRTCTLPVSLEPNHEYRLGLNSTHHINFQSKWGVPLAPVEYNFKTHRD